MIKDLDIAVRPIAITVPLADEIPDSEGLISYCARVSNPNNQLNFETADRLLAHCVRYKHWSIFEMANLVLEIKAPRDITRQLLRHRSFSFQEFCVAKGTKIKSFDGKQYKIEDLYDAFSKGFEQPILKVYDESSKTFTNATIKEVFYTGPKDVYEISLNNGSKIKSTLDHKFLTDNGFHRLSEINVGDKIACNGIPCYQNKDWLVDKKLESIKNKKGLSHIAEQAGVSYHTIRKWLKRHNISYTKQEVSLYTESWNKNLPKQLQPRFGKLVSDQTRHKMKKSARSGLNSNLFKNGESYEYLERHKIFQWQNKYKNKILKKYNNQCVMCGSLNDLELDHIKPVVTNPELAYDIENLQILCKLCHRNKSNTEITSCPKYSKIKSIEYIGVVDTYDLEINHHSHNYIANNIVTHNSQRYAVVSDDMFCLREMRLQDTKNRQNSIKNQFSDELQEEWKSDQQKIIDLVQETYHKWIDRGGAKECVRSILPEGMTMSCLYVNGTVRSWIHYTELRTGNGTQAEHMDMAKLCSGVLGEYFPSLIKALNGVKNDV